MQYSQVSLVSELHSWDRILPLCQQISGANAINSKPLVFSPPGDIIKIEVRFTIYLGVGLL